MGPIAVTAGPAAPSAPPDLSLRGSAVTWDIAVTSGRAARFGETAGEPLPVCRFRRGGVRGLVTAPISPPPAAPCRVRSRHERRAHDALPNRRNAGVVCSGKFGENERH